MPCSCKTTTNSAGVFSTTALTISCANQTLNDTTMETVFSKIPVTAPIDTVDLSNNSLTFIPNYLTTYPELANVILATNNITSIGSNDLQLVGNVTLIDISSNQITSIADNSFPSLFLIKF